VGGVGAGTFRQCQAQPPPPGQAFHAQAHPRIGPQASAPQGHAPGVRRGDAEGGGRQPPFGPARGAYAQPAAARPGHREGFAGAQDVVTGVALPRAGAQGDQVLGGGELGGAGEAGEEDEGEGPGLHGDASVAWAIQPIRRV